jgi:hypothetical protein
MHTVYTHTQTHARTDAHTTGAIGGEGAAAGEGGALVPASGEGGDSGIVGSIWGTLVNASNSAVQVCLGVWNLSWLSVCVYSVTCVYLATRMHSVVCLYPSVLSLPISHMRLLPMPAASCHAQYTSEEEVESVPDTLHAHQVLLIKEYLACTASSSNRQEHTHWRVCIDLESPDACICASEKVGCGAVFGTYIYCKRPGI